MGFYGNIVNSNKASFTFDKVYPSRKNMDDALNGPTGPGSNNDGIFLGRYVLVEYDEAPIKVYMNGGKGYADAHYTHAVEGKFGFLYQDVITGNFYEVKDGRWIIYTGTEPYAFNYRVDVENYGRNYDSTAWMKRYDVDTNTYSYVMVAELNTVIPQFHVVVDPPAQNADTPYFDKESTNLDYYLHLKGDYQHKIRKATKKTESDEEVTQDVDKWTYKTITDGGVKKVISETYEAVPETIDADIYYNNAGFDHATRTYSEVPDKIGYELTSGGRNYFNGIFDQRGKTGALDTKEWYFRLPAIGNAISKMWDKVYGYNGANKRYLNKALMREDTPEHLVSYDPTTLIGMINTCQDWLGYHFIEYHLAPGATLTNADATITTSLMQENGISQYSVTYKTLECIFWKEAEDGHRQYYQYAYNPSYTAFTGTTLNANTTYYYKDSDGVYHLANQANYQALTADGGPINPLYNTYYTRTDCWSLEPLALEQEDTIYGLIVEFNKLLGTNCDDVRSLDTVHGCINTMKDIIERIDLNLTPGRLLHTNDSGVIETTSTYYPSSTTDANRVLVGNPEKSENKVSWENRVRKIGVLSPETSESVWTTNTGTVDTNANNNNVVNFKAGNKWIGFNIDTDNDQLIQVLHTASTQAAHDFATDVVIDDDIDGSKGKDCEFTIPLVKTDNAGHVIGYTTKTIYVPYGYHNIILAAQSAEETAITTSNGTQSADATNDNFTFATGNQWIEARVDEDKITFAHALIDDQATQKWEFKSTATTGWQAASADGNKLTIPTFEIDNAGHIVRSDSVDFYIPHNFRNITVGANGADTDATQTAGTIEADSTTDTWTIASQNKWLKVAADATNDKITIGHIYSEQAAHDFDTDVEIVSALDGTSQTDNKIVLPVLKTDNAGHVIGYSTNTFYIPHNFKSITVVSDDSDVDSTQTNGTLVADNIVDTWTFAPQNKWIDIAADPTNDKITIGHKYSPEQAHRNDTGDTVNQTPAFGATFKVPNYETDKAGHITKSSAHTVMIPQNSYTETADKTAGVLTTMSLDKSTGAFTATRANVGTLALTEYVYDANNIAAVSATDSINVALSKVEAQIAKEVTDRGDAVSDLNDNITAMNERLVASDNDLSTRLTNETTTREFEDTRILGEANTYTDTKVAELINSAPETLNTLNELAMALGGDENFATTVAQNIGANTAAINAEKEKIDAHIANKTNPHAVTASQVGLGNVTNESKETMFTNPAFTGVPTAPTADAGTNSEQLATTAFVAGEVANAKDDINASLKSINESITKEIDARERADQARHEEFTNALAIETQARLDSLEALLNDLLANYGITLNVPTFEITQEEIEAEEKVVVTISASDECTMIWYKKQLDADPIAVSEAVPVGAFDIIEDGEYYCVITRTHNGHTSEAQSEVYNIVVPQLPEPEPEPEPEPDPEIPEEPEA